MRLPAEFDLHAIEVFLLTVEHGTMTQCATHLNLTQSAVSQTIAKLEHSLGAALFDRKLRPLALTATGKALFERGQSLLAAAKHVYDQSRERAGLPMDSVTIGMSESLAIQLTAPMLHALGGRVRSWKVRSGISAKQHDDFLARRFDMLVTGTNLLEKIPGIDHHSVVDDPFVLVFPRDYRGSVSLSGDIAGLPFIRYSLDSGMGQRIERQIVRMKLHLANVIELDVTHQQLTAVSQGLGWSITSLLCLAAQMPLLNQLRIEPLSRVAFSRRVQVVARSGELGQLPADIAQLAQRVLAETTFPPLVEALPWLGPLLARPGAPLD